MTAVNLKNVRLGSRNIVSKNTAKLIRVSFLRLLRPFFALPLKTPA